MNYSPSGLLVSTSTKVTTLAVCCPSAAESQAPLAVES